MHIAERKDRRDLSLGAEIGNLHAKDSHSFRNEQIKGKRSRAPEFNPDTIVFRKQRIMQYQLNLSLLRRDLLFL